MNRVHDGLMETEHDSGGILLVDAQHPSLGAELDRFFDALHDERRYFGPSASANPKPFRSLIESLRAPDGVRMAAIECGRAVGVARVDTSGELFIVIVDDRRGTGVGTMLGRAVLDRAAAAGYRRVVLRTTRRSRAARRVGEHLGCTLVERARGRADLIASPRGS
jgi:RimJ/RimL family protein N-acetyltransferase